MNIFVIGELVKFVENGWTCDLGVVTGLSPNTITVHWQSLKIEKEYKSGSGCPVRKIRKYNVKNG